MAGPGICVLILADACASEVYQVFNPVAQQFVTAVTAPLLVGCVVWRHVRYIVSVIRN